MCVCVCVCSDAIPTCDREEFVKEAAEVPNFLQEVEECKHFQTTDSAVLSGEVIIHPHGEMERQRERERKIERDGQED